MYFSFRCGKGFIPLVRFWLIIHFYWNNAHFTGIMLILPSSTISTRTSTPAFFAPFMARATSLCLKRAGPLLICPRVQNAGAQAVYGFQTGFRMGVQLFAGGCLECFPEHLPTGICAIARVFWRVRFGKAISLVSDMRPTR
jgi:hypothetical protein